MSFVLEPWTLATVQQINVTYSHFTGFHIILNYDSVALGYVILFTASVTMAYSMCLTS